MCASNALCTMGARALDADTVHNISVVLAQSEALKLPARFSKETPSLQDKEAYLTALLQHDPGVFLERHGKLITGDQLAAFEPLREESYEIDFYLKLLSDDMDSETPKISSTAKNRRLAKMTRLAKEGYFEEEPARKRAPLLHHQYLGQYKAEPPLPMAGTLHDQIYQQHEELQLRATMATQRREEEAAAEAFEATISESEEESDDEDLPAAVKPRAWDDSGAANGGAAADGEGGVAAISAEEMQQNREDFRSIMEARFLNGEDGGREADDDATLDEDWAKQRDQDLEDAYFSS